MDSRIRHAGAPEFDVEEIEVLSAETTRPLDGCEYCMHCYILYARLQGMISRTTGERVPRAHIDPLHAANMNCHERT